MPKELIVTKAMVVDKPCHEVFEYLKFCKNQEHFSVWNMADPHKKTTAQGTDGTEGFLYSWDSTNKNVGAGSQRIVRMVADELIEYELLFERPMKNRGTSRFVLSHEGPQKTKVVWEFRGETRFPMNLLKGFFQKMLGKDIAKSLENLKQILETL
jgi:uncharacterized protein YndB with AHSA1/START domain